MFSHFFIKLNNIVSSNLSFLPFLSYSEMRRKLWPKAPARKGTLDQMSKNFVVYFMHTNFFKKPNKNTKEPKNYTAMLLYFFFFDSLLSTCPKEMENWKMAQGCQLSPTEISKIVKMRLTRTNNCKIRWIWVEDFLFNVEKM